MINWNSFKNQVVPYFESLSANSLEDAASFIANVYDATVRVGGETLAGNFVIAPNKPALETQLRLTFLEGFGKNSGVYNSLENIVRGLNLYWTGAQLSLAFPPAGTVGVLSNIVVDPGVATGFPTPPVDSYEMWVDQFISVAKTQLISMKGQMVALIPTPTGPVPTQIPWFGYY